MKHTSDMMPLSTTIDVDPPRRSAWLVTLYYTHGWNHGTHLRTFAFAREWVRRGADVHFIAARFARDNPAQTRTYLEGLREAGVITSFDEVVIPHPAIRGKLARAALFPRARDIILGPERRQVLRRLEEIAQVTRPELFVYAARHLLYAVPHLRRHAPVVIDWMDSWTLYHARHTRAALAQRQWLTAGDAAWRTLEQGIEEHYYGRLADENVFVSPVDADVHARFSRGSVATVGNGVRDKFERTAMQRTAKRLIFTGAMDFPPNHQAAIWFIRRVLPRIVAVDPEVHLVVAGGSPPAELRALAGTHVEVTGYVDDIRAEMARSALYVAPLISGSGFKNKVVEALAAGLNVVGTSLAFEFLTPELKSLFRSADDPAGLASAILAALQDERGNDVVVERFWDLAGGQFEWDRITDQFVAAASRLITPRDGQTGLPTKREIRS